MLAQPLKFLRVTYHLKTNNTTTDDSHLLGHFLEVDGASAGNDLLLVDRQAGEWCSLRASGDENVLATDSGLATLDKVDCDGVFVLEGASSLDVLDIVLLEEELNALGQTRHGSVLRLHHSREVELDIADFDTTALGVVEDLVVEMRVVKERFRGDAANVQASSAKGAALFDACDL